MSSSPSSSQDLFRNRTALVTGASAGLGAEFARQLAARGCRLILTARRKAALEELATELVQAIGATVRILPMDLARPGAANGLARLIKEAGLSVDLLINNAGFGHYGPFVSSDAARDEEMIRLNIEAVTTLIHQFLPGMVERDQGGIINLSSTAAFQPIAGFNVYSAGKSYVLHLSEALAEELRSTQVRVTALCPGPTYTEFQSRSNTKNMSPSWTYDSPERVVADGLAALEAGQTVKVVGTMNRMISLLPRFFPRGLVARSTASLFDYAGKRSGTSNQKRDDGRQHAG